MRMMQARLGEVVEVHLTGDTTAGIALRFLRPGGTVEQFEGADLAAGLSLPLQAHGTYLLSFRSLEQSQAIVKIKIRNEVAGFILAGDDDTDYDIVIVTHPPSGTTGSGES